MGELLLWQQHKPKPSSYEVPDHLVDYVILHELVHTKIKNHSRDFWQLLDMVSGNAKKLDKEVKQYRIQIY